MRIRPALLLLVLLMVWAFILPAAGSASSSTVVVSGVVPAPGSPSGGQGGAPGGGGGPTGSNSNDYVPPSGPAPAAAAPPVPTFYGQGPVDTTQGGAVRETVRITTLDGGGSLLIPAGSTAFDSTGHSLGSLGISPVPAGGVPASPSGATLSFSGTAYDFAPAGASFDQPATLTIIIPGSLPVENTRFFLLAYDRPSGTWNGVPATLDPATRTLTGPLSQAGIIGLFTEPVVGPPSLQELPSAVLEIREEPEGNGLLNALTALGMNFYSGTIANLSMVFTSLLIASAGLFAYPNRALLSRYQPWITLYLISMTGVLWAIFLYSEGGPPADSVFLATTVAGLNLMVHIFRFDRVTIPVLPLAG